MKNRKIKVLIADDHKIFRDGILSLLGSEEDVEVIGEAANGREVMTLLKIRQPDLILMDISMGESSGIETTLLLKKEYPHIKVLVLSMHSESSYVMKMLELGASGYLLKDAGKHEMLTAIRTVASGNTYYSSEVSARLVEHLTRKSAPRKSNENIPLTSRELEVLKLIAEEYPNPKIPENRYNITRTGDTHRRNLIEKLKVKNTAGLVKFALQQGLINQ